LCRKAFINLVAGRVPFTHPKTKTTEAVRPIALFNYNRFSAALLGAVYVRSFYDKWQKIPVAAPAINIDVKVRKENGQR